MAHTILNNNNFIDKKQMDGVLKTATVDLVDATDEKFNEVNSRIDKLNNNTHKKINRLHKEDQKAIIDVSNRLEEFLKVQYEDNSFRNLTSYCMYKVLEFYSIFHFLLPIRFNFDASLYGNKILHLIAYDKNCSMLNFDVLGIEIMNSDVQDLYQYGGSNKYCYVTGLRYDLINNRFIVFMRFKKHFFSKPETFNLYVQVKGFITDVKCEEDE